MQARIADKPARAGAAAYGRGAVLPVAVPRLLAAIHAQRPDLSSRFDLRDPDGRDGFLTWCLTEGRSEYPAITDLARSGNFPGLHEPDPACPLAWPTPLTGLMRIAWCARGDARAEFALPGRAEDFVWWFFLHGAGELMLRDLVPAAALSDLNRPVLPRDDAATPPVTRLMRHVWRARPDLQRTFDPRVPSDRIRFVDWFLTAGIADLDLAWLVDAEQAAWRHGPRGAAEQSGLSDSMVADWHPGVAAARAPAAGHRGGVDLVGYARGELGIGEDVRMLARALAGVSVAHTVVDVPPGPAVRQQDRSLEYALADRLVHDAVVFAMTGMETVRVVATRGFAELKGRYVIGHWPWELPGWPRSWDGAYDLVDEIWAPTRYTRDAYADGAPVPVLLMPPAVELPAGYHRWRRADFGLPEGAFLFHFSFDFLSYPHRKNPWACLEAFARAFPSPGEPVGLVVKTMRADRRSPAWRRLRAMAGRDPRIILIDRTMDRAETIGLMAATNAYVSLHRAEGFGRGLAEAMLLERPVIATGFSGSNDFLTGVTGFPVEYRMVPVRKGQYPGSDGQSWAEPSVDHAAELMRRVYEDAPLASAVAAAGRRCVETNFSPVAAGRRYGSRLAALGLIDPPGR